MQRDRSVTLNLRYFEAKTASAECRRGRFKVSRDLVNGLKIIPVRELGSDLGSLYHHFVPVLLLPSVRSWLARFTLSINSSSSQSSSSRAIAA